MLCFNKSLLSSVVLSCAALLGSSCQAIEGFYYFHPIIGTAPSVAGEMVIRKTYLAVDHLCSQTNIECACSQGLHDGRILVGTLVDINDVDTGSMFGLQSAEFIAARLTQKGYRVINTIVRDGSVVIREDGQFILSRDIKNLSVDWNAAAVAVGTYGVTGDKIYVSLRMVCTVDNTLLSATDFVLPRCEVDEMLAMRGRIATW